MKQPSTRRQRGVSLIEALVALAVMSIGMLGLVSLQTSLRGSSDVAKQRSEAVRRAQQEIEHWRAFTVLNTTSGSTAFADLTAGTTSQDIVGTNATYTQERIVADLPAPQRGKALTVNMSWTDRNGETQSVRLATAVAGIAPELAATMTVPGDGDTLQQPQGRHRGIPPLAKHLGEGRSGHIPPNTTPGVVWIFQDTTGLISLCTTTATSNNDLIYDSDTSTTDNVTCGTDKAVLVSGFVRYDLDTVSAPNAADAANPQSRPSDHPANNSVVVKATNTANGLWVDCSMEHVDSTAPYYSAYYCAVPVTVIPGVTPYWTGNLSFKPTASFANSTSVDQMRACRYHSAASYTLQSEPLTNQNFLLIRAGDGSTAFACTGAGLTAHQPS